MRRRDMAEAHLIEIPGPTGAARLWSPPLQDQSEFRCSFGIAPSISESFAVRAFLAARVESVAAVGFARFAFTNLRNHSLDAPPALIRGVLVRPLLGQAPHVLQTTYIVVRDPDERC